MTTTNNYPDGEAGALSESGPVDAADVDGARDRADATGERHEGDGTRAADDVESASAAVDDQGALGPASTATGASVEPAPGPLGVHARAGRPHPTALVDGNRVSGGAGVERRAVVLGGGGVAGVAWEAALLSTLLDQGITLTEADIVVGTSAGSIVGTALRSGRLGSWAAEQVAPEGVGEVSVSGLEEFTRSAGAAAQDAGGEVQARAAVGALAQSAVPEDDAATMARFEGLLPVDSWPEGELRVTAVDASDGSFSLFDKSSGVPLERAIAASCAVPGVYPVVTIDGRPYMDGGARSATNADAAADCQRIVVISCGPEPDRSPLGPTLTQAVEALQASAAVLLIEADPESLAAFGSNSLLLSTREPATAAGRRQGSLVADEVRAFWGGGSARGGQSEVSAGAATSSTRL